jgi:hypothetical protein
MGDDARDRAAARNDAVLNAGRESGPGISHADRIDDDGGRPAKWRIVGPGLVVAATGVGAADMVATLVAGSRYGYGLFWAVIVGVVLRSSSLRGPAGTRWPPERPSSRAGGPWANGPPGTSARTS